MQLVVANESARDAWLRERQKGIGSSEAAIVAGVSPRCTPVELWLQKTGRMASNFDEDAPMIWGKKLEPLILDEYREKTGYNVTKNPENRILKHPKYEHMIATLDAVAIPPNGGPRVLEAKATKNWREWGEIGSDSVPLHHVFQTQHQLAVTGYTHADIPVLISGFDFRIYTITRDEEIIKALVEVEQAFWHCVQEDVPPPIKTPDDARALFPKEVPGTFRECTDERYLEFREMLVLRDAMDKQGERCEAIKAQIQAFMGDAELLTFQGETIASWKRSKPKQLVDNKKLKQQYPLVYAECIKPAEGSRTFLIKEKLEEKS